MKKIKQVIKKLYLFFKKHIWIIIAFAMILISLTLTFFSYLVKNVEAKNILQNFGLGLIASSFVSLFIEIKNYFQIYSRKKELKKSILLELKVETLKLYSKCFVMIRKFCNDYKQEIIKNNIFSRENSKEYFKIYDKIEEAVEKSILFNKNDYKRLNSHLRVSRYDIDALCMTLNKINYLYYTSVIDVETYRIFKCAFDNAMLVYQCDFDKHTSLCQKKKQFTYTLDLCSSAIFALKKINFLTEDEIQDAENI